MFRVDLEKKDGKGRWIYTRGIAKGSVFAEALFAAAKSKMARSGDYLIVVNDVPFGKQRTVVWDHYCDGRHYLEGAVPPLAVADWKKNNPEG